MKFNHVARRMKSAAFAGVLIPNDTRNVIVFPFIHGLQIVSNLGLLHQSNSVEIFLSCFRAMYFGIRAVGSVR